MKVVDAIAHILKKEGVRILFAYPLNPIIEAAAKLDIRTVIVRQERVGLHMADCLSRMSSGQQIGVFCMQHGPGSENSFGGVAQAYSESSPIVVLPMGYPRTLSQVQPNFQSALNYRHVTKSCEQLLIPQAVPDAMRRAFSAARNGRPRPALVEIPGDLMHEEGADPMSYRPTVTARYGPAPEEVRRVAEVLIAAERPVIYAGQGIHYAQAWAELKELAELLEAPVTTSLSGKSAFPENHPLYLGCANRAYPKTVKDHLCNADVIFAIACSLSTTSFGIPLPRGKRYIHATLDPGDINKDVASEIALIGDARLTLQTLTGEISDRLKSRPRGLGHVAQEIREAKGKWLAQWMPKLTSSEVPLSPYRVIWDLLHTVDVANTIVTHDAGSPRDQMTPFWETTTPLSYIGWGKTTQLGYGFGLTMGAKLARPEKLCINVWGDAAIGFTGMDFETAVRERIPILSVLLNNSSMACEISVMPVSTAKYRSTDISGSYAKMALAFGAYGEQVTEPREIVPAIHRGIQKTREGVPALLEFVTARETEISQD
jgi:thiamine pyrophosphate-dependent acetolactate synthase large subunit-like protein